MIGQQLTPPHKTTQSVLCVVSIVQNMSSVSFNYVSHEYGTRHTDGLNLPDLHVWNSQAGLGI